MLGQVKLIETFRGGTPEAGEGQGDAGSMPASVGGRQAEAAYWGFHLSGS